MGDLVCLAAGQRGWVTQLDPGKDPGNEAV